MARFKTAAPEGECAKTGDVTEAEPPPPSHPHVLIRSQTADPLDDVHREVSDVTKEVSVFSRLHYASSL